MEKMACFLDLSIGFTYIIFIFALLNTSNWNCLLQTIMISSHSLKTIFQHKACTDKLYADSFYKVQKNSHSSFEVICCRR